MKILFVGDPHVVSSEFKDCWALVNLIDKVANKSVPDHICILGDLYHNHSVIDAEVMLFWDQALNQLTKNFPVIVLKGNHDQPNNKVSSASSLIAHKGINRLTVVDHGPIEVNGVVFIPYASSQEQLVEWVTRHPKAKSLICHNTFKGAVYDNGTIAHDYYDQSLVPQEFILSGHIHTPMELRVPKRIVYPGAPRWRTASDANTERSLMMVNFKDGSPEWTFTYSTAEDCSPIFHLVDDQDNPLWEQDLKLRGNARYIIDIKGSESWIKERKAKYPFARIRSFPVTKAIDLKESDGIAESLAKWSDQFVPLNKTPKEVLQERLTRIWPKT